MIGHSTCYVCTTFPHVLFQSVAKTYDQSLRSNTCSHLLREGQREEGGKEEVKKKEGRRTKKTEGRRSSSMCTLGAALLQWLIGSQFCVM